MLVSDMLGWTKDQGPSGRKHVKQVQTTTQVKENENGANCLVMKTKMYQTVN